MKAIATNSLETPEAFNYLVLETDIDKTTTSFGLVKKIESAFRRTLGQSEPARKFLSDAWSFIKGIEAAGIKLNDANPPPDVDLMLEDLAYSLAKTVNRICSRDSDNPFSASQDGVVLLIDEADSAGPSLDLGTLLKLLLERLQRHSCDNVMLAIAGLSGLRDVLRESHPSSLRLFDDLVLERLGRQDVEMVINLAIMAANQTNEMETTIDLDARQLLVRFAEGYPHFIQQFGYSAFAADTDGKIDENDVLSGATGSRGALESIGNRYFRDSFYNKIRKESYRQVLRIMADQLDAWVTKKHIRDHFQGSASTLDNAIQALRGRNIIVSKEGARGVYRLQHKAFALWIKIYATVADRSSNGHAA